MDLFFLSNTMGAILRSKTESWVELITQWVHNSWGGMVWENVEERWSQFLELYVQVQVEKLLHTDNILSMLISWHEGQH